MTPAPTALFAAQGRIGLLQPAMVFPRLASPGADVFFSPFPVWGIGWGFMWLGRIAAAERVDRCLAWSGS